MTRTLQQDPFGEVHYEAELVAVIGKTCRNVSEDEALDYVLGYSCGNDVSARGLQVKEMATGVLLMSKGMDSRLRRSGPCIATDLDPSNLEIMARLNGETKQHSNTNDLLFNVAALVAYTSQGVTLNPGDCIYTGHVRGAVGAVARRRDRDRGGRRGCVEQSGGGRLTGTISEKRHDPRIRSALRQRDARRSARHGR